VLWGGAGAPPAAGRAPAATDRSDPRWLAYLGCWEAVYESGAPGGTDGQLLCILPVAGEDGVDMATVEAGLIVARERVTADGLQRTDRREGCNGWESAAFSGDARRVYLRTEYACEGGLRRSSTGLLSMASPDEWLDVQVVAAGAQSAVRVIRYRAVGVDRTPEEVTAAIGDRALAIATARAVASSPLAIADVTEATTQVDGAVVEAWLLERQPRFAVDAGRLIGLADAGVPESVIDLVVALSYPNRFAVNRESREGELRTPAAGAREGRADAYAYPDYYDPFYWDPFYRYSYGRYGSYHYSPYGYGTGYGWYSGYRPVIIVVGETGEPAPRGRVVNGRGYTRQDRSTGSSTTTRSSGGTAGASTTSSTESSATTGSSSTGTSTGRTAKPRTGTGGGGS
jgi:hypothetical protein